jgi:preprotein translocase SecE subunit
VDPVEEKFDEPELGSGAPPTDLGQTEPPAHLPHIGDEEEIEDDLELEETFDEAEPDSPSRPRKERPDAGEPHGRRRHNRLIGFLIAVWAELQRVEWPDRQTLTMLTGVVLLFVIVMGAYLGLLDAVFSKVIDKIL